MSREAYNKGLAHAAPINSWCYLRVHSPYWGHVSSSAVQFRRVTRLWLMKVVRHSFMIYNCMLVFCISPPLELRDNNWLFAWLVPCSFETLRVHIWHAVWQNIWQSYIGTFAHILNRSTPAKMTARITTTWTDACKLTLFYPKSPFFL